MWGAPPLPHTTPRGRENRGKKETDRPTRTKTTTTTTTMMTILLSRMGVSRAARSPSAGAHHLTSLAPYERRREAAALETQTKIHESCVGPAGNAAAATSDVVAEDLVAMSSDGQAFDGAALVGGALDEDDHFAPMFVMRPIRFHPPSLLGCAGRAAYIIRRPTPWP